MAKLFNRAVQIAGENRTVGTPNITVLEYDKDGNVIVANGATVPTDADAGYAPGCYFYKSSGGSVGAMVYINEGSATSADFNAVAASSTGVTTWDAMYDLDTSLTVDGASLTFAGTHATNDVVTITNASGSGDALQITQSGSGNDIQGTSNTWKVDKTGAATFVGITPGGDITTTAAAYDWDLKDNQAAALTFDAGVGGLSLLSLDTSNSAEIVTVKAALVVTGTADLATITATNNGALGTAAAYSFNGSGTYTGATTLSFFYIAPTGLTTGTALYVGPSALTTGKAVEVESDSMTEGSLLSLKSSAAGITTGSFITVNDGSERFSVKADGATTIASGVNSTVALLATGIQTSEDMVRFTSSGVTASAKGIITINSSGNSASGSAQIRIAPSGTPVEGSTGIKFVGGSKTMQAMDLDGDSVDNSVVLINGGGALASGKSVLHVTADGTPASGAIFTQLDFSGATMTNNPIGVQIKTAGSTGAALDIVSTAATGKGIAITNNSLTTGEMINLSHTTSVIASGGALLLLSSTSIDTATTTGCLLDLTSTASLAGTQVLGTFSGLTTGIGVSVVTDALTSGQAVSVTSSATAIATTGRLLLVDHTGATGTSAVLNEFKSAANDETTIVKVTGSSTLTGGVGLDISLASMDTGKGIDMSDLAAITTGKAIHIDATGTTHTDGILVHIDSAGTAISSTGRLLLVDHTGATTTSSTIAEIKSAAADETVLLKVNATAALTGTGVLIDVSSMVSGEGLRINATTATLTTGNYINCYDGAANDFTVADDGATTIAGNAAGTNALTVSAGDVAVTSGYVKLAAGGIQSAAVARTASADGTGTGTIADGTTYVTAGNGGAADNIIVLPTPTPGNIVYIFATGALELRSDTPASVAINGGSGAGAESALGANTLNVMVCTSATTWVGTQYSTAGVESAVQVAAA